MSELFPEAFQGMAHPGAEGTSVVDGAALFANSRGVHALWYSLYNRPWTGLAVLSPDDAARTWPLVQGLAATAVLHNLPVTALSALEGGVARLTVVSEAIRAARARPDAEARRFLVAVDSPLHEPAAMTIFEACDAVLLLLWKGETSIPAARRLLETLGTERVIGAVLGSW